MMRCRQGLVFLAVALVALAGFLALFASGEKSSDAAPPGSGSRISAWTPYDCGDPAECGALSPLIAMHTTAVHAGQYWAVGADRAKLLVFHRFPEYRGVDIADPEIVRRAIAQGALSNGSNDFNASLRPSFRDLAYGGYNIVQGLSQTIPTRILSLMDKEGAQIWDLGHPDAFKNTGKFFTAELSGEDFAANAASFADAGTSRGLDYDIYCEGRAYLESGVTVHAGGHDMNSHNGMRKVFLFDPKTERWAPRTPPCQFVAWQNDRYGEKLYAQNPHATHFPGCNPRDINSTQPPDPSDLVYPRWYPDLITLPNNKVLVVAGSDLDERIPPDPPTKDERFRKSRINQPVPEIYDPETDTTRQLECAAMLFPSYPQAFVVPSGPGVTDWKVAFVGGQVPATVDVQFDGPWTGRTWLFDVQAAEADPACSSVRDTRYWTEIDYLPDAKDWCCPTAEFVKYEKVDEDVRLASYVVYLFGGKPGAKNTGDLGRPHGDVLRIDFLAPQPRWRLVGELIQPALQRRSVALLPDGTVFLTGGNNPSAAAYPDQHGFVSQIFDPRSHTSQRMVDTTVPRHLHGNAVLLQDGTVLIMGQNREDLVPPGDPVFPPGDPDLGVANGQRFFPPYLYRAGRRRPRIVSAPDQIRYRDSFQVEVSSRRPIRTVVMIRETSHTHHTTINGVQVQLPFADDGDGELTVAAPSGAAPAVPGPYMLFVVDQAGVPSSAKLTYLTRSRGQADDEDDEE